MAEEQYNIDDLVDQFLSDEEMTPPARAALEEWLSRSEDHRTLLNQFRDTQWLNENLQRIDEMPMEATWEKIVAEMGESWHWAPILPVKPPIKIWRMDVVVAAAVLLCISSTFLVTMQPNHSGTSAVKPMAASMAPVTPKDQPQYKTLLTLSTGVKLALDTVPNGRIDADPNYILIKKDTNSLEFHYPPGRRQGAIMTEVYTLSSRAFNILLADSSKVALGHGSTLGCPLTGDSTYRKLSLSGQAYFHVARDAHRPFIVHTDSVDATSLGTRFDVLSYHLSMASVVTLLDGSVKVDHRGQTVVLDTSVNQAVATAGSLVTRKISHAEGLVGWREKRPYLRFWDADLETVLQRIAPYYGMHVENPRHVKGKTMRYTFMLDNSLEENIQTIQGIQLNKAYLEIKGDAILISDTKTAK